MYAQYMCILLYVKLMCCNGILWMYCSIRVWEEMYLQYMYIILHVKVIWCNMVFHRCIFTWTGGYMYPPVYVHSAMCETYVV